jgi:hypothetical protein
MEREIAGDLGISSPPGRLNTVRWILGRPLQFDPGTETHYSNIGCLTMGLIVEQESGQDLVNYVRSHLLTTAMWVPSTDLYQGRTFREWQDVREPTYDDLLIVPDVFDNYGGPLVSYPYGGWDHEARIGQGGYAVSAAAMLEFAQRYHVGAYDNDIGRRIDVDHPLNGSESHNGAQGGLNSSIWQRNSGGVQMNVWVVFNKRSIEGHYGDQLIGDLVALLDSGSVAFPTATADGFWVLPGVVDEAGVGGYDDPFTGLAWAVAACNDGSKIRLKPGVSPFTGIISTKLLIDAPLGTVTIGLP